MEESAAVGDTRLETGVQRLDFILKGGLFQGATYSLVGPPGSGKTVLGNQICFNHVRAGGRALYVTVLAENHSRMLSNLKTMRFFDIAQVPERVRYVSGYKVLEEKGLAGLLSLVRDSARAHKASLLVVDGIDAAGDFAENALSFRRYLHEQQASLALLGCTTLLLSPKGVEFEHPENATVDGIIELSLRLIGPRAVREVAVHKFRGSDYLLGRHEVEITEQGMVIHPRTEVQFSTPLESGREDRIRMPFGVPRLDEALHGGVLSGSATTLLGSPGTGKTLLGLQFLATGAEQGQPGVYFGFFETPPRLVEKAESIGIPLAKHVESGKIEIQWQPPLESNLDALAERLLERIRERDVQRERLRLFVDGVSGFRAATVYADRMGRFFSALTHQLRVLDVTTLFAEETPLFSDRVEMPNQELGGAVENVILLRHFELRSQLYRLISIMKMRESAYDRSIREFIITDKGLTVAGSFESAEALLSGHARQGANTLPPEGRRPKSKATKSPRGSKRRRGR